jgi:hypothetical protein
MLSHHQPESDVRIEDIHHTSVCGGLRLIRLVILVRSHCAPVSIRLALIEGDTFSHTADRNVHSRHSLVIVIVIVNVQMFKLLGV